MWFILSGTFDLVAGALFVAEFEKTRDLVYILLSLVFFLLTMLNIYTRINLKR